MNRTMEMMADLTASRDCQTLDSNLVLLLGTMFPAIRITLVALTEEAEHRLWLIRARHEVGADRSGDDGLPSTCDVEALSLSNAPSRWLECLLSRQPVSNESEATLLVWPLLSDVGDSKVLEVRTNEPLSSEDRFRLMAVLRVYRNMCILLDGWERDALTGLLNRGSFDTAFLQAITLSRGDRKGIAPGRESRRPLQTPPQWLGALDIDHFKQVNDAYGHVIGDEVLVLVARIMRETFRAYDRLYRFGGEEFAVLLSAPDEASAAAAFERLRSNLEAFCFPRVGRVTASIGFTRLRPGDLPQSAFDRADRAVYHGKRSGRNQVHSFEALVNRHLLRETEDKGAIELFAQPAEGAGQAS